MKRMLAIIGLALGMTAQLCAVQPSGGPANIAGTLYASNFATWSVPQGNNGPFSWSSPQTCTNASSGGVDFQPFVVGSPIRIVDNGTPVNSEIVTPTAVNITGSGCTITVNPSHQHYSFYLTTATAGLQDAINYANQSLGAATPAAVVILTPAWAQLGGTTAMITSAIGNSRVTIVDQRTSISAPYIWDGTKYVFTPYGGGANPAPPQYAVQFAGPSATAFNADSTFSFNTSTHGLSAYLTNGGFNSDVAATGGGNNGIANLIAGPCVGAGCAIARPQTSTDTETIQTALNSAGDYTHALDNKYGVAANYFLNAGQNGGPTFREANPTTCMWSDTVITFPNNLNCKPVYHIIAVPSRYQQGASIVSVADKTNLYKLSRSISQVRGSTLFCYSIGDCAGDYQYIYYRGGSVALSDEGTEGKVLEMVEQNPPAGVVTVGGANATMVTSNFTSGAGLQGDGYYLLDTSQLVTSGNLLSCTTGSGRLLNSCTTSDTHAVSTAYGVTTAACGTYTARNAPASATCTINVTSGAFTANAGDTVCVGDYQYPEQAAITAVGSGAITVALTYAHVTGTPIYQGGLCGEKLVMGNGLTNPVVGPQYNMTTYVIAGSRTSTSLDYIIVANAGQVGNVAITLPTMPVVSLGTITRASNVVSVANSTPNTAFAYNNYVAPSGAAITVSGATPSDLNGTVTGITVTPVTISWAQTGSNETGSGGTLSVTGLNNYFAYCGAETVFDAGVTMGASSTTTVPIQSGKLQLEANNCNWTVGDSVVQPNHYANPVIAHRTILSGFSGLNGEQHIANQTTAGGQAYSGTIYNNYGSGDALSSFVGYGGTIRPHQQMYALDVESNLYTLKYAPVNFGYLFSIGCPPEGCLTTSYPYDLFRLSGLSGTSLFTYSPSVNTFSITNAPLTDNSSISAGTAIGVSAGTAHAPGTSGLGGFLTPVGPGNSSGYNTLVIGNGTVGDSTGTFGANNIYGAHLYAGSAIPPAFSVYQHGTSGSTTYTYACTSVAANGESPASTATITTGNATLSATNYIEVACFGVPGAQSLNIYRTVGGATQGKIANVPNGNGNFPDASNFDDTGIAGDGTSPPGTNTTGSFTGYGPTSAFTIGGSPICTLATGCGTSMVYPGAGVPVSTGTAWGTSIPAANIPLLPANNIFTGAFEQFWNAVLTPPSGSGTYSSGQLSFAGQYNNGTSGIPDQWNIANIIGSGTTPPSTLTFTHSGTPGTVLVSFPTTIQLGGITGSTQCLQVDTTGVVSGTACSGGGFITSLTTTGTSGPATVTGGVLNIPQYAGGSSGFPITLGSTSIAASSTTTSVSGLTIDGVSPTTMGYVDFTSSGQTQLNAKVTHTAGALTANQLVIGNGSGDVTVDPDAATDGAGNLTVTSVTTTGSGGSGGGYSGAEGTAISGASGRDAIWADSTDHRFRMNNNNGGATDVVGMSDLASSSAFGVVKVDGTTITASGGVISATGGSGIANTTATVGTTAVAANTCTSATTVTMTGVATTSVFIFTPNADVSAVTGWGANGGLTVVAWPTANTLNYKVCNQTASSITPGASVTFNVGAR